MEQSGKKYEFTVETIEVLGRVLHRIKAIRNFGYVKAGALGGFIEKEENLSHEGNCWVYNDAKVYGDAEVCGNANVCDNVNVCGNAKVHGNAWVYGYAYVCGNAEVYGNTKVCDDAYVCGNANVHDNAWVYGNAEISMCSDFIVFKNWWSSGRYFTWTRSNNMWKVGCFYGTGEELIQKAYKDSEISGREYERVVRYVESILADEKKRE